MITGFCNCNFLTRVHYPSQIKFSYIPPTIDTELIPADSTRKEDSESDKSKVVIPKKADSTASAAAAGAQLIEEETAETGTVKAKVYAYFFRSVGLWFSLGTVIFFTIYQTFQVSGNLWLSRWTEDPRASTELYYRNLYLGIYGLFGALTVRLKWRLDWRTSRRTLSD